MQGKLWQANSWELVPIALAGGRSTYGSIIR